MFKIYDDWPEIAKNAYLKQGYADYQLDPNHGSALFWSKSLKD